MTAGLRTPGATHRDAPFCGRRRELGILAHLIEEGLWGDNGLVRVDGAPGMGRRRLIAEALHRGPDAELVQLAPGGVHADLRLWLRTEMLDLLETYPNTPVPSWALHVLARWEPRLRRRAAVPALSAEKLPAGSVPEIAGAAVGAILRALTGRTLVIVDLGLWPEKPARWPDDRRALRRMLDALWRSLTTPGVLALTASTAQPPGQVDQEGVRTLSLEPLRALELEDMVAAWNPATDPGPFGRWLHRFTRGNPFFVQEVVRWLEELGHLKVNNESGEVALIDPLHHLPLPFNLNSVMESRYQRLPPEAARLLHLITKQDGRLLMEDLRRLSPDEDEVFEEALATLRMRGFLLHRTFRRPVATAGPRWTPVVEDGVRRMPRLRHRPRPPEVVSASPSTETPLAHARNRLRGLHAPFGVEPAPPGTGTELARIARMTRGRTGPAWDGVRGRLAVVAALWRRETDRIPAAQRWVRWGLSQLSPEWHPGLRRTLARIQVKNLVDLEQGRHTTAVCESMRQEALAAGHLVNAVILKAAVAEGCRRQGRLDTALRFADEARTELADMGLAWRAELAAYTAIRARVDLRRLAEAETELARSGMPADHREEIEQRLEALRSTPPLPLPPHLQLDETPVEGWRWGVDHDRVWERGRIQLMMASAAWHGERSPEIPRWLESIDDRLETAGQLTDLADLTEFQLWIALEDDPSVDLDPLLSAVARMLRNMEAGDRGARLANLLRSTRAVGSPVFQEEFRPLLGALSEVRRPSPPPIRLLLLGRPRVERPDSVWPMALWPEWWARLWVEAIGRDIRDLAFSREEAERILADTADAPRADLALLLNTANQLLREEHTIGGGLWLDGDRLRVNWSGIHCDLKDLHVQGRAVLEREGADDDADARSRWYRLLSQTEGALPTQLESRALETARSFQRSLIIRAMREVLAETAVPDPETCARWLEGPGRFLPVREELAGAMERWGRPRAASALRNG